MLSADGISTGADNVRFEVMDWNDKTGHTFIGITKKMRIAEFIRSGDQGSLPEDRKKEIHASWGAPDKLSPVWAQLTKREDVRDLKGQLQLDVTWGVAGDLDQTNADVSEFRSSLPAALQLLNVFGIP